MPIHLEYIREAEPPHAFEVAPHHATLSVPDLEASIAWYRKHFGFAVEIRQLISEAHAKGAFLRRGSMRIELFEVEGAAPMPAERANVDEDLRTHGVKHFAMQVDDAAQVYHYCIANGIEIAMPLTHADGTTAFYIRDNSGILVEIAEPFV